MPHPFDEVGDGIFRRRYEVLDQNIGIVLGEEAVAVIDTRSIPSHADEIAADLRRLTALPVGWVVNTHWHWDHVLGNSSFAAAEFWGHQRCREVMLEEPEAIKAAAHRWLGDAAAELDGIDLVAPGKVFTRDAVLDLGGRKVELAYRGKGHTDADVTVRIGDVLFAGDLLEEGAPPAYGDSYPQQWPDTIAEHLSYAPRLVVPGHGDVMEPNAVATQVVELRDVARRCAAAASEADLDFQGAPYPTDVIKLAFARSVTEQDLP
ncbi:MAG: MBL fold metallo-hydrolase [bacterium]|nr:MBL fold metallo-hydrolase [bacterium]